MRDQNGELSLLERIVGVATLIVVTAASTVGIYGCDKKKDKGYERPDNTPKVAAPSPDPPPKRRSPFARATSSGDDLVACMNKWEKAQELYKRDQFGQARVLYQDIFKKYPNSEYAPRALFMMDMSLDRRDGGLHATNPNKDTYRIRITILEMLLDKYPTFDHDGVGPDAVRLKLVILHAKLGNAEKADTYLKGVKPGKIPKRVYGDAIRILNQHK
jgi:hypothetical protein